MADVESPFKEIVNNLKENEIWADILDATIWASTVEELKQIEQDIEQDKTISGLNKMRKKIAINVKGNLFFGDERKNAIANEKEDAKSKNKKNKQSDNSEATSDTYDSKNMQIVQDALIRYDITNAILQKAILSTIAKESKFKPQTPEKSYKDTNNKRIREIFGARVSWLTDAQLTTLKADEQAFRDRVYGPDDPTGQSQKLGNTEKWDGMKYRWRWFNGITFKKTYQKYGDMINEDLVNQPELLERPDIAAKVNAAYFAEWLKNPTIINLYGDLSSTNDFDKALKAAVHINAGIGKSTNTSNFQENYNKALAASTSIHIETQA